tara:strand:+ start:70 stop:1074 length:1005 start_codon:yes stop_codon:yes gene_type:complete
VKAHHKIIKEKAGDIDFFKQLIPSFPFERPTLAEAKNSFNELCLFSDYSLKKEKWFAKGNLEGDAFISQNKIGLKASNYFHWQTRMACDSLTSPSAIRNWYDRKLRISLEKSIYYKDSPSSWKTALSLRKYIPSQFRPTAAKLLLNYFKATRWYDPCGGWGDRLLAAQSYKNLFMPEVEYFCREVNPLLFIGYAEQVRHFGGKAHFEYKGSEEDCPVSEYFDLVFTSPPYYKVEKYQGEKQSHKKYKKFEDWVECFLLPMLTYSWKSLKKGGVMAINIANVYANHTHNDCCSPVIDFLKKKTTVNLIGYQMGKRPNSFSDREGIYCEPIIYGKK